MSEIALLPCRFCGRAPGVKFGPPSLARCITPGCEGTKLAAYTFAEWNEYIAAAPASPAAPSVGGRETIARLLAEGFYVTSDEKDRSWDELPQWHRDRFLKAADAILRTITPASGGDAPARDVAVTEGWPTQAMLEAGGKQMADIVGDPYANAHWMYFEREVRRVFHAMLSAAPASPAAPSVREALAQARKDIADIQRATIEGRVCDDVAWYDTITTLHDFCAQSLDNIDAALTPASGGDAGAEPVAWRVHSAQTGSIYDKDAQWFYPTSRESDAKEAARFMRAECEPLYAHPPASSPHDGVRDAGAEPVAWREAVQQFVALAISDGEYIGRHQDGMKPADVLALRVKVRKERVDAILRAAAAPLKILATDETGWLIEKDDPPVYHQLLFDDDWTPDVEKALRFARREDAQAYVDHTGWTSPPVRVVEHMWPLRAAPASSPHDGVRATDEAIARAICAAKGVNPDCLHQNYDDSEPVDAVIDGGKKAHFGWRNQLEYVPAFRAALTAAEDRPVAGPDTVRADGEGPGK